MMMISDTVILTMGVSIVVGIIGLYFALKAHSRIHKLQKQIEKLVDIQFGNLDTFDRITDVLEGIMFLYRRVIDRQCG